MRTRNKLLLGISSLALLGGTIAFSLLNKVESVETKATPIEGDISFEIDPEINESYCEETELVWFGLYFRDEYNNDIGWADRVWQVNPQITRQYVHYTLDTYPKSVAIVRFGSNMSDWNKSYVFNDLDGDSMSPYHSYADSDLSDYVDLVIYLEEYDIGNYDSFSFDRLSDDPDFGSPTLYDGLDQYLADLTSYEYYQPDSNQNGEFGYTATFNFAKDQVFYVSDTGKSLLNYPKIKGIFDYYQLEDKDMFICKIAGEYKVIYNGNVTIDSLAIEQANQFCDYFNDHLSCPEGVLTITDEYGEVVHPSVGWGYLKNHLSNNEQCRKILSEIVATSEMTSIEKTIRKYDYIVFYKKPYDPTSLIYKDLDDFLNREANDGKTVYSTTSLIENSSNTTFIGAVVAVSLFSLTAIAAVLIVKKKYQN